MAQEILHTGKRNWWDGSFTTLCGQYWPDMKNTKRRFFGHKCPECLAVLA